jgi:hypothetical protein
MVPVVLPGVLLLARVVLVLEYVPLGALVKRWPAWLDVVLRTAFLCFWCVYCTTARKGFRGAT